MTSRFVARVTVVLVHPSPCPNHDVEAISTTRLQTTVRSPFSRAVTSMQYNNDNGYHISSYLSRNYTGSSDLTSSRYFSSRYSSPRDTARWDSDQVLPSKYSYTHFSSTSRAGRSETKVHDVVRPSMRAGRHVSMNRDVGINKLGYGREHSLPRARESARDYMSYKTRQSSPIRASHVPEFREITSDYNNRLTKNGTRVSRGSTISNGRSLFNGHTSPQAIEIERRINKPTQISVDERTYHTKVYSPTFAQNRTSNNNKESDSKGSSRSSTSSRRDEPVTNGEKISSSHSTRELFDANAGLVGLKNIGNTCFMNSILQCLSNTKDLRNYCVEERYKSDINRTTSPMKGKLVEAFSDIIFQLWHPSGTSAVPTSQFKSQIQKFSKRFSGYEQQDSQEFLRFLIEGLHEDVNEVTSKPRGSIPNFDSLCDDSKAKKTWDFYLSKDKSFIVNLFMGQLKSSLQCAECEHISTTFDPFWDLSLPIPKNKYDLDLQHCLSNFTKEETLDGDERPTCGKCRARRRMTKKFTIYKFPKILVIHLKRFSEGQRFRHKLSDNIVFPHRLEIASPVSISHVTYNLYAVSNHSGSCYGGHYTAYCKNPQNENWYKFNDTSVTEMSQSSVQSKEAYVLFYELSTSRSKSHL